ncbi:Cysteine--tRNA ligase [uncultured archaeon]|nr:Cysteine--tRNA ligase [uncultured archaeon]
MKLFDTLTRKKRVFAPLRGKAVRIYTCGPSVYAYSHIGNFRTYLFEDVLVRYLEYKGYRVRRVMNITDVEDKAVEEARREGRTLAQAQKDKIRTFFSEWDKLGLKRPGIVAKASEHVPEMASLIRRICSRGYCRTEPDGVYFDVRKFGDYGKLRRLRHPRYFGKACDDDYVKEGLWDFRLWKRWAASDGKAKWKSPFGEGRPGWHIECSAISMRYLGEQFDIHCGGADNIYPHHENEIAQSMAATGKMPARFWLHCRHLTIHKKKMSKRTGNVFYVGQLREMGVEPSCLRFYLISSRYRNRLDFTMGKMRVQLLLLNRAKKTIRALRALSGKGSAKARSALARKLVSGFESAMDDDLNTRLAFKRIFRLLGNAEKLSASGKLLPQDARGIVRAIEKMDSVLGVLCSSEPC